MEDDEIETLDQLQARVRLLEDMAGIPAQSDARVDDDPRVSLERRALAVADLAMQTASLDEEIFGIRRYVEDRYRDLVEEFWDGWGPICNRHYETLGLPMVDRMPKLQQILVYTREFAVIVLGVRDEELKSNLMIAIGNHYLDQTSAKGLVH